MRFICVSWVMWIHIPQSPALAATTAFARFRLPVFLMLATFFLFVSQQRRPARTFFQYAFERLHNIYLPFLGWAAIYYLFYGCIDRFIRHNAWPPVSHGILFHGQTVHLWFVPFVVFVGLLTFPVADWLLRRQPRSAIIISVALLAGLIIAAAAPTLTVAFIDYNDRVHIKDFLYRAITLAPAIPLGITAYFAFECLLRRFGRVPPAVGWTGLSVFCICLLINCFVRSDALLESVAALAVVLVALCPTHNRVLLWLAACGRYSFGMYLVHMLFVDGLKTFRQSYLGIAPCWWFDVLVLLLSILLSLLLSIALSRNRYTRWLAPASPPPKRDSQRTNSPRKSNPATL